MQIKVAMIYQPGRVTPIGAALNYQITTTYVPLFDRPPLIQRFQAPNGQQFFVIVNHFKSKGSCPASGVDLDYGQGCWNVKRTAQANGVDQLHRPRCKPTDPDVIVIGDLNAYGAEDPIVALEAGGLIDQVARTSGRRSLFLRLRRSGRLSRSCAEYGQPGCAVYGRAALAHQCRRAVGD